jgi:hypothetical protein
MEEEKKYTKVKIFLFLVFAIFAVMLIATIARIMQDLFSGINEKTNEYKCNEIDYEVKGIIYEKNILRFELRNKETNVNISKILVSADSGNYEFRAEEGIGQGESLFVKLENVTLNSSFGIFLNDCKNMKNITLK